MQVYRISPWMVRTDPASGFPCPIEVQHAVPHRPRYYATPSSGFTELAYTMYGETKCSVRTTFLMLGVLLQAIYRHCTCELRWPQQPRRTRLPTVTSGQLHAASKADQAFAEVLRPHTLPAACPSPCCGDQKACCPASQPPARRCGHPTKGRMGFSHSTIDGGASERPPTGFQIHLICWRSPKQLPGKTCKGDGSVQGWHP